MRDELDSGNSEDAFLIALLSTFFMNHSVACDTVRRCQPYSYSDGFVLVVQALIMTHFVTCPMTIARHTVSMTDSSSSSRGITGHRLYDPLDDSVLKSKPL